MRILKKLLRRLYHLIAFLSLFIILCPKVNAVSAGGVVSIDGSAFETASWADFADNSNGQLTRVNANYSNAYNYFVSVGTLTTTGGSTYGANIIFDANQVFVSGYTYVVSILIGFGGDTSVNPRSSTGMVCVAETLTNAVTRWNNQTSFPCPSAYVTYTNGQAEYDSNGMIMTYGLLNYVFTANVTGTSITMAYNTTARYSGLHYFGGYKMTVLSDNKNLTQSQITSAVQSSGLATASSVSQVQSSINEVKQELSGIDDTLNDSSVDSSDDTLSDLQDSLPTNSVISDILLLPVRLLQAIINSLDGTCSSFNLGSLYGTNLVMPCIDIEHYVGSSIWTFIDLVFSGMFVLVIRKKFIQIWENITNLKGGANEVD